MTVEKVKDPKRVEQGKRLAAISKEAKARKAAKRAKVKECVENANLFERKKEQPQEQQVVEQQEPKKKISNHYKINV